MGICYINSNIILFFSSCFRQIMATTIDLRNIIPIATILVICLPFISSFEDSRFLSSDETLKRCVLICARGKMDLDCPCYFLNKLNRQSIKTRKRGFPMPKDSQAINMRNPNMEQSDWLGALLRHNSGRDSTAAAIMKRHNGGDLFHTIDATDFTPPRQQSNYNLHGNELQFNHHTATNPSRTQVLSGIFKRMMQLQSTPSQLQLPSDQVPSTHMAARTKKRWLDMADGFAGPGTLVTDLWQDDSGRNRPFRYGRR